MYRKHPVAIYLLAFIDLAIVVKDEFTIIHKERLMYLNGLHYLNVPLTIDSIYLRKLPLKLGSVQWQVSFPLDPFQSKNECQQVEWIKLLRQKLQKSKLYFARLVISMKKWHRFPGNLCFHVLHYEKYLHGPGAPRGYAPDQLCNCIVHEIVCQLGIPCTIHLHDWSGSTATQCSGPCKYFSYITAFQGLNLFIIATVGVKYPFQ